MINLNDEYKQALKGKKFIDLFCGLGGFRLALESYGAEWILVAKKTDNESAWILKPINVAINHYSDGKVEITNRGSLKIGRITMQRKGRRCRKRYC